ncbi:NUDIX domain-containing protein [Pseudarthrobacter phenanthrenivorans]|uniref:NUDIX domain-containing protein n=2 Tax=Pseudarthrobacter phenanthrenivorans TaxID=361575 RepID=A0A3B0FNE3_PSEPS|nr:NUDIX domain-containing protein [Pseudarthrobacter phenanthrenivorans]ADX71560.1 putative NTP pyrophosphohydrolase [Pseudarthrobacter phenanthrenivorans Sphe3]RKO21178.1 NUDIX domain-containing protein [Pseudarthrobacter phenanthrenivorans]
MPVLSAGILLYRRPGPEALEVWIAHMGGPFWAGKDAHAWSIPKGEYTAEEDPLAAALREFAEEMGTPAPDASYRLLGEFRQPSGKRITVFAAEHDFRPERIASNTFPLEWPRGSGKIQHYPEIDDARWFSEAEARVKLVKGQLPVLDALRRHLVERNTQGR